MGAGTKQNSLFIVRLAAPLGAGRHIPAFYHPFDILKRVVTASVIPHQL